MKVATRIVIYIFCLLSMGCDGTKRTSFHYLFWEPVER
jgi:hypothetical protein